MSQIIVSVSELNHQYREGERTRTVLNGVTLELRRGERLALLGRSGSGKSTLLNLLGGIDTPHAGRIRIDGTDITRLDERARTLFRRRHIGFIYQFYNLIPTLTVAENVRLPLELNHEDGTAAAHKTLSMLARVGLADYGDAYPDRLSGGEQQRVAIARALVHEPLLILADEPTGNLDAENGQQVLQLLDRLTRDRGGALVLVTHSRAVAQMADRMLSLVNGRLSEDGAELTW